jgi:hypothetical protein
LPLGCRARLGDGASLFLCTAFSPDGKLLASGGYEKTITIWDATTGKELRKWDGAEGNVASLAFSPNGLLLASGSVYDPVVHLWNVSTGQKVRALQGLPRGTSSLSFSPDGTMLAAGGYQTDEVHLWKVAAGEAMASLSGPAVPCRELDGQPRAVRDFCHVAFDPDGKTLASGHLYGLIRIWDTKSLRELRHFRGPIADAFVHVTFSPDGRFLAGWGRTIRLWRTDSWKQFRSLGEQPEMQIAGTAVSPDGRMLASGSAGRDIGDDKVHIWEVATGSERCQLTGHRFAIASLAFSPDGKALVSGSRDGTALIWDVSELPQAASAKSELSPQELEGYWQELADSEAPRAFHAIRALIHAPGQAVEFLKTRLQPVHLVEGRRVRELVAVLESDRFRERQQATEELAMQAELVEPALRQALSDGASAESRRRLEEVLHTRERDLFSPRQLQILRAIEVLEKIGTPDAEKILKELACGTAGFQITREAAASLIRLKRRAVKQSS